MLANDGYSPDYPGSLSQGSNCKIQISQVVAKKLFPHI